VKYRQHDPFERAADRRGGEVKLSVGHVARPSRRHRSFGRIDVFGRQSDSTADLLHFLVKGLRFQLAVGRARASAWLQGSRYRSGPNQTPQTTPKLTPFLLISTRQYGASEL
jgi:hypothetical protein